MIYKRCDNPPCHNLAPLWEPYCCPKCKKTHYDTQYNRQQFGGVKDKPAKKVTKPRQVMTDEEQTAINNAAWKTITERMAQPLTMDTARRMGVCW